MKSEPAGPGQPIGASFRDPSGYVFREHNKVKRYISADGLADYQHLVDSGLYEHLVARKDLVSHTQVGQTTDGGIIIEPTIVEFISYPYEWCFGQLKEAALLTLSIMKKCLDHGMVLKDASAFNVQFHCGKAVFIDTTSIVIYENDQPWRAYLQFCKHFLAPLYLMKYWGGEFSKLSSIYLDGIPVELASALLPWQTWLRPAPVLHLHMHAKLQKKHQSQRKTTNGKLEFKKHQLSNLIHHLESTIKQLDFRLPETQWKDYYKHTNYEDESDQRKISIVEKFVIQTKAMNVWDVGSNDGKYSRLIAPHVKSVVSMDIDFAAVEKNYQKCQAAGVKNILPLLQDLTNPSSAIGWAHSERDNLIDRAQPDLVLALALVHHLAISNNVPFKKIAEYFAKMANTLIIEFVDVADSQVKFLLGQHKLSADEYCEEQFLRGMKQYFKLIERQPIAGSQRTLFLFRQK